MSNVAAFGVDAYTPFSAQSNAAPLRLFLQPYRKKKSSRWNRKPSLRYAMTDIRLTILFLKKWQNNLVRRQNDRESADHHVGSTRLSQVGRSSRRGGCVSRTSGRTHRRLINHCQTKDRYSKERKESDQTIRSDWCVETYSAIRLCRSCLPHRELARLAWVDTLDRVHAFRRYDLEIIIVPLKRLPVIPSQEGR